MKKHKRIRVAIIGYILIMMATLCIVQFVKDIISANIHTYIFATLICSIFMMLFTIYETISNFYTHSVQGDKLKVKLEQGIEKDVEELNKNAERNR